MTNKTYKQKDVDRIINTVNNIKQQFIESIDCQLEKLQNLQPAEPEQKEWRQKLNSLEPFYFIGVDGDIEERAWEDTGIDEMLYESGNCFPCKLFTKEQVQQIALMNRLNSLLYQYAVINNALASEEEREDRNKFLFWIYDKKDFDLACCDYPLTAIFNNREVAQQAIEDVVEPFCKAHPDFVW